MNRQHDYAVLYNALSDFVSQGGRCIPPCYRKALRNAVTAVIANTYSVDKTKLAIDGDLADLVDAILSGVYNATDTDELSVKVMAYRRVIVSVIRDSDFMMKRIVAMMNESHS